MADSNPSGCGGASRATEAELGKWRRERLGRSRLYFVCDAGPEGRGPREALEPALVAGVDIVQLRDKEAGDDEILDAARAFRQLCHAHDALFFINDRPDLALASEADGVHLGQDDMQTDKARKAVGPEMLIGLSTHSQTQIEAATGSDYISVGPVFMTPTKPDYRAVGVNLIRVATTLAAVPFFAIGGIDVSNVDRVVAAGARRVAVVRAIRDASDPGAATRALLDRLTRKAEIAAQAR